MNTIGQKFQTEKGLTVKMSNFNTNGDPKYIGFALPGVATSASKWKLMKLSYDASLYLTDVQFADGNENFDNCYDIRGTYVYS